MSDSCSHQDQQRVRGLTNSRVEPHELLERVVRAGGLGVWELDPVFGRMRWNDAFRQTVGLPADAEESLDRWLEAVHPEDRAIARQVVAAVADSPAEASYRIVRPGGELRHVLVRVDRGGGDRDAAPVVGVMIDVTNSYDESARIVATLDVISDGYFALDRDWDVVFINRKGEEFLGKSKAQLIGRSLWESFPEAVDSTFFRNYRKSMEEGVEVQFEEFYPPLDKWFEVRSYPSPYGIAVYFRDVTRRHEDEVERSRMLEAERNARELAERAEARMAYQATHDALTDLLNRTEFTRQLDRALSRNEPMTIVFLDVDRFKLVNDSLGHGAGDELLRTVARRLARFAAENRPVARFGGDEFVVAMPGRNRPAASALAERILETIREPIRLGDHLIYATASIGIAESQQEVSALELVRNADVALYRAKDSGRDRAAWFDEGLRADLVRRLDLEQRLRNAIERDGLHLEFQPAFDLRSGEVTDIEALARWTDPELGSISPGVFIPVAEDSGLIHEIGSWATSSAARMAAQWSPGEDDSSRFWVNISPRELARPDCVEMVERHIEASGLAPDRFGIEVTESALVGENIVDGLRQVSDQGMKIAIDDFGTGYSSISRLSELPVDFLKVDRSFVSRIDDPAGRETVAAIVDLGHAIDACVIAEGVETEDQLRALAETGCDRVCGFLLARPVRFESLDESIASARQVLRKGLGRPA